VGEVIREQGGDKLFECVETARNAAIRRREGVEGAAAQVEAALHSLDATAAAEVVRAFSTYFLVVNLAERVHRIRRGYAHERGGGAPREESLADTLEKLDALGVDRDGILDLFASSRVEPVFTAHPSESTRRIILEKQERIAHELIVRIDPTRTPHQERASLARIRENVTASWQTEEHPSARPTVSDEREHVLYYVTHVLYDVLPALHERLDDALSDRGIQGRGDGPALVRVGSWVGGDMDGNPNVGAETIRTTLQRHRDLALGAYMGEIEKLARQLSQSASRVRWSDRVSRTIEQYAVWFPDTMSGVSPRYAGMGYRTLLELIGARLRATGAETQRRYAGPGEFLADVTAIAESLEQNGGAHAGLFGVRRLLRRVRAFGFHLAVLDVRQDARELRDVVADILDDGSWPTRSPEERTRRLREMLTRRPDGEGIGLDRVGERAVKTMDVFTAIAEGQRNHGPDAIGPYIISMAQDVDDVLTVMWLATLAGLGSPDDLPLDVAPLFETVADLERAPEVLERLFSDPTVRPHLNRRGGRQMVMVGYSDSNKDGGIASARWALQRALEGMAGVAAGQGVTLTVFHGRGGTVSRGGGSVQRAVAAMPAAAIGGRLRLTEQGEVIDAKYGLPPIALRNLEQMLGSIVLRAAQPELPTPPGWLALADTMSTAARAAYRSLVHEDPRFTDYFRAATPIDVIERMAIGSRPASRRSGAGVDNLRAIPWVFSWTQCRAMLTGWYGLGSGLEAALQEHGKDKLREAAADWPFFDALLADVEMVLAKADLEIAGMYTGLAPQESRSVFEALTLEYDRTVAAILDIRGSSALLESEPTLQRSIRLRNPYVDPMNILQVDLLRRWREEGRPDGELCDALLATVNGIARGLQNTG
jgi:phosphoenolpyruvate carboxylase